MGKLGLVRTYLLSKRIFRVAITGCLFATLVQMLAAQSPSTAQYPSYPSETPGRFEPRTDSFDYVRREVMIPMRDGVKLHTVILIPKGAKGAPILLTRTPYSANELTSHDPRGGEETNAAPSSHLGPILNGYDNATEVIVEGGYIRVVQDVRGKYGSEGDYVMNRPLHGPQNPTPVDHSTDTYDTIDWLVKNIPESNGKVGILGISYDGFLPLMALVNPHPALKVAVPMNPMVDGWMGDDWFHNGAFRQQNMSYIYEQEATRKNDAKWWSSNFDDYDMFMQAGSAGELGRIRGLEQVGFWRKILEHPTYDAFWRDQAMDQILAAQPLKVPVMLVHSLWDQEDIYGAIAVYKAIKPKDTNNDKVFLVMGPWHHGQEIDDGSTLGAVKFNSDTGLYFRQNILRPFLDQYLKDGAPKADVPPVTAFETGTNTWRRLPAWPAGCAAGCSVRPTPLYLTAGLKLGFTAPKSGDAEFDEYTSDPAKPVPFRARPIQPVGYTTGYTWAQWLVDDQREASGRPDVLAFVSDTLRAPVKISGQPDGESDRLDQRHRLRLGGEADRRLSRRGGRPGGHGRVSIDGLGRCFSWPLSREPGDGQADCRRQTAVVPFRAAHGESCLSARPQNHGADPVELVPALRPQSADFRAKHLLGQTRGLSEGGAAGLSHQRRGQLHRVAAGHDALIRHSIPPV